MASKQRSVEEIIGASGSGGGPGARGDGGPGMQGYRPIRLTDGASSMGG